MSIISKTLYIIIFVIAIIVSLIYLIGQKEVEAAKVTVEITKGALLQFNESERDKLIGDVSLGKVYLKKLAVPKGNDMYTPGISVGLFRNKIMISEWTSVPIHDKGLYELIVGLNQPINEGDVIRIAVYVNDNNGNVIIGKRKDVVWD